MKIFLLSESNSPHTIKWVTALADRGMEIILFSITENKTEAYKKFGNIIVESGGIRFNKSWTETRYSKLIYLKLVPLVRKLIKKYKPDILHAHYATSYGLLGALSNFQPFLISVWGSDVLSFPHGSFIHKNILKYILSQPAEIFATSYFLAHKTSEFTRKSIKVIPFGVNSEQFNFISSKKHFNDDDIVVGTVKSLETIYGVDTLIKSFSLVKKRNQDLPLKLFVVGSGSKEKKLKYLAANILDEKDYFFTGYMNPENIQAYHSLIDVSVYLSLQESFGVSTLEAMASSKPVVVSRVGGLAEIVDEGENGFIVSPNNPEEAAIAIERLVKDPSLRIRLGENGKQKVRKFYDWNKCVDSQIENYQQILSNRQTK
jgi:glycosyltransferase involved in cell wall biosynthesis